MALKTKKGSDIPEGSVLLSKEEALKHQWDFIINWPSELEVFSIKFGRHLTTAMNFISSWYLINSAKKLFNIGTGRYMMTVTPGIILPSFIAYFQTDSFLTDPILLMNMSCPLCQELKFAAYQYYMGLLFPILYGHTNFFLFASITKSIYIPKFKTHPKDYWKAYFNLLKQSKFPFQVVGLAQTIFILGLPFLQNKQLMNVMNKSYNEVIENEESNLESGF